MAVRPLKPVQKIPHANDKEIGFEALKGFIKEYTIVYRKELKYLEIEPEDFIQDVFFNMIRRNGYPQYHSSKNKGTFKNYVFCNCKRYQIDLSRKIDTKVKNLASLTNGRRHYMVSLNQQVMNKKGDSSEELINLVRGDNLDTSALEVSLLLKQLPEGVVSLSIPVTQAKLSEFFIQGYSDKEVAKIFGVNFTEIEKLRTSIGKKLWSFYSN